MRGFGKKFYCPQDGKLTEVSNQQLPDRTEWANSTDPHLSCEFCMPLHFCSWEEKLVTPPNIEEGLGRKHAVVVCLKDCRCLFLFADHTKGAGLLCAEYLPFRSRYWSPFERNSPINCYIFTSQWLLFVRTLMHGSIKFVTYFQSVESNLIPISSARYLETSIWVAHLCLVRIFVLCMVI